MADTSAIEKAIADFRAAVYGPDVRAGIVELGEAVKTAVADQLIEVDATLSESGKGADAKAVGDIVTELKTAEKAEAAALYGSAGSDFPLRFENGTYYYTAVGSTLQKYYGGGFDKTRKVIKTTTFHATCPVKITAKNGYVFTAFSATSAGVITASSGLVDSFKMTPGSTYGMTLRTEGGSDDISAVDVSDIVDIEYTDKVTELSSAVTDFNCIDYLDGFRKSSSSHGITFAWNGRDCQVTGTSADFAICNLFYNPAGLPGWMTPGETYYVSFDDPDVTLQIWFYKNNAYYTGASYHADSSVTVPSDATGCLIRLAVNSGTTVNTSVFTAITNTRSNADLLAAIEELEKNSKIYILDNDASPDDLDETGIYLLTGNTSAPTGYGLLFHYKPSSSVKVQILYQFNGLDIYYHNYTAGSWKAWESTGEKYRVIDFRRKYIAFGDSLMYGALWNTGEDDQAVITRAPYGSRIPDRIARATGCNDYTNLGVGGMAYTHAVGSTPRMIDWIKSQDIGSANLITVAGGRNDGGNPLGTPESESGGSTICGSIREIVEYIRENNPTCQIVVIQATPYTSNNTPWTAHTTNYWSLNDFDEQVSALCKDLNVGYASWYGCSLFSCWSNLSGGGNNWAHMKDADSYVQMGDFIAGQVSKFFMA